VAPPKSPLSQIEILAVGLPLRHATIGGPITRALFAPAMFAAHARRGRSTGPSGVAEIIGDAAVT
jgi:hypothetical protein